MVPVLFRFVSFLAKPESASLISVSLPLCVSAYQELEKARAIIAARLATKDGDVTIPTSAAANSSNVAMSMIAHGYESDSEEEEGEVDIEHSKARRMEKKAKLQKAVEAVGDAIQPPLTASIPQAVDQLAPEAATSSRLNDEQITDGHSSQAVQSESRRSNDHKSHCRKDSSTDRRDRDRDRHRRESLKSSRDRTDRDTKHHVSSVSRHDHDKDVRRSGDEKVASSSQGETTSQHSSRKSRERETTKELSGKLESEQRASNKDEKGHSSKSRETSGRHEAERTSESEKRHSEKRRSDRPAASPDTRHRSSHSTDKKTER